MCLRARGAGEETTSVLVPGMPSRPGALWKSPSGSSAPRASLHSPKIGFGDTFNTWSRHTGNVIFVKPLVKHANGRLR
jgi:hypothetical protein